MVANLFECIEEKSETAKSLIRVSYEQFQDLVIQAEEHKKQKQEEPRRELMLKGEHLRFAKV
ncbi:MAG: hypothetical protein ACK5CA_03585 [Cyanobacteriota bacterium]|jgi:hypothetical protein